MKALIARFVAAATGGALVFASFPPVGWWPAAFLGLALLVVALGSTGYSHPRTRTGLGVGLIFGFVFFLLLLPWVGLYVGAYASWALALVEGLYLAAFGAGAVHLVHWGAQGGLHGVVATAGLAAWWSLWESIRGSWPWGGFPWGSLAFGHADGVLLPLASLGGARFLGAAIAASGFALGLVTLALLRRASVTSAVVPLVIPVGAVLLLSLVSTGFTRPNIDQAGVRQLRVAVIQGNVPRLGLDFTSQQAAVLENHLAETHRLAERIETGLEPRPDMVLWPENASDIPALDNASAAEAITDASEAVDAPISLGTIDHVGDGPQTLNTQLVWDGAAGAVDRHDKKYLQPFGEWLPWRGLFEALVPIAEHAGHFVPGEGDGTLDIAGVTTATATCFEVAFDAAAREPISAGAQVLTVPTNNATFGHSPMTYQQLAMSRVRAVEHNVPVVVAATSGVSAIIRADGTIDQQSAIFESATLTADIPVGGAGTPATQWGGIIEVTLSLVGAGAVAVALALRRRRKVTANQNDITWREATTPMANDGPASEETRTNQF